MKKAFALIISFSALLFLFCGCASGEKVSTEAEIPSYETIQNETLIENTDTEAETVSNVAESEYQNGEEIYLNPEWRFADFSEINSGCAIMYTAQENRNGIIVAVNAGHGTEGGRSVKTYCHPDKTPKVTGGTTEEGAIKAVAVSSGMSFNDGEYERDVNFRLAVFLRDLLLQKGFDVLMIRNGDDVQLDNVARTVIANNVADCHIALHFDGDSLDYDKGAFYISTPDGIKYLDNVAAVWEESEALGECLIDSLRQSERPIRGNGSSDIDLTQTSYSTIPSVDMEMGNQCTDHSDTALYAMAEALADGISNFYNR